MNRILVVEDERHLADGLRFNLEAEGHWVDVVESGEAALELLATGQPAFDLVLLDVMLPGLDGFAVAARLRDRGQYLPVLMLTARGRPEDILRGFQAGADDYLPKPFELSILLARVNGLLRRVEWARAAAAQVAGEPATLPDVYEFAGKAIDFPNLQLHQANGIQVPLTVMEANLLRHLVEHEGQAVPRKQLLEQVWGVREDTDTRAIDAFMVRLRRYVEEDPANPRHLETVRGVGYRFIAHPGS